MSGVLKCREQRHTVNLFFFNLEKGNVRCSVSFGNEVYALASITLCDNLLIGRYKKSPMSALTDVGPKRLKVRENARAFSREKKNCP